MLLDKEIIFEHSAMFPNLELPVLYYVVGYENTNHPEDVEQVRKWLDEAGIKEDFYFITGSTARSQAAGLQFGSMLAPAMASTACGINYMYFDCAMIEAMLEIGMDLRVIFEHELTHLRQLDSKRLVINGGTISWLTECGYVDYEVSATRRMDPLGLDVSTVFQFILPWEEEAYEAELAAGGDSLRAKSLRLSKMLVRPARLAVKSGKPEMVDMILWVELVGQMMVGTGLSVEDAERRLEQMNLSSNVFVRINELKEVAKSIMSNNAAAFNNYCRRSR